MNNILVGIRTIAHTMWIEWCCPSSISSFTYSEEYALASYCRIFIPNIINLTWKQKFFMFIKFIFRKNPKCMITFICFVWLLTGNIYTHARNTSLERSSDIQPIRMQHIVPRHNVYVIRLKLSNRTIRVMTNYMLVMYDSIGKGREGQRNKFCCDFFLHHWQPT